MPGITTPSPPTGQHCAAHPDAPPVSLGDPAGLAPHLSALWGSRLPDRLIIPPSTHYRSPASPTQLMRPIPRCQLQRLRPQVVRLPARQPRNVPSCASAGARTLCRAPVAPGVPPPPTTTRRKVTVETGAPDARGARTNTPPLPRTQSPCGCGGRSARRPAAASRPLCKHPPSTTHARTQISGPPACADAGLSANTMPMLVAPCWQPAPSVSAVRASRLPCQHAR